ncbi:MAG: Rpn family recombination-promoting nuclease/putative transposase [Roseburia sp.]|nr:Rpn family recombination-promoting nuclease/putative transposase [Roseburia sp.]MCM1242440.1 Rpn family recombination-promoting nuclease/putative transposase [Roseburia sp.]
MTNDQTKEKHPKDQEEYETQERQINQTNLANTKVRDSSAKLIFKDPILCAQFLRDYVDIPLLKTVQPEDIEDITTRYVHMFTEERDSDIVKRVHIKNGDNNETPFYLISLIEHKSQIDYNVVMQVLRYIVFIWEDYEKEMEQKHSGISKTERFRYPPILPILFYDGADNWMAAVRLHDRVLLSNVLGEYIPDYRCMLIRLGDYSNAELMEKKNELSVVMLIDRLKNSADFSEMKQEVNTVYLNRVTADTPEYLLEIIAQITEILLEKLNVPREEAEAFAGRIKERKMGELLANFEGWDVQALRREAKEAAEKAREEDIGKLLSVLKSLNISRTVAKQQLMKEYELSEEEANKKLELY